ncbi:MAG: DUF190 domain-containing protein [bacterium]
MRALEGEQVLMRIHIGESDRYEGQPLYRALVEMFREQEIAGATVFKGIKGFGAHSLIHTDHLLRLSQDLPIGIEVVDSQEQLDRIMPLLDEMVQEGLVTMERVKVVRYAAGNREGD